MRHFLSCCASGLSRLLILVAAVFLAACETFVLAPPPLDVVMEDSDNVVDPALIVVLAETRLETQELIAKARGRGYLHQQTDVLEGLGLFQMVFAIPSGLSGGQAIAELEAMQKGVTAGVNHAYRPQRDILGRSYARSAMEWPEATCPLRQSIGVIDGGFVNVPDGVQYTRVSGGDPAAGTHGAEIVSALMDLVTPDQHTLYLADVLGRTDGADLAGVDSILRGVSWLLDNNVYVMNISLAGPYNKILDRGLQRARDRGALIVAAAGNDGPNAPARYPAALSDVVAVTAIDADFSLYSQAVRGPHIDIAAPGVDVFLSAHGGVYRTGTSYAAPFVTAFFAAYDQNTLPTEEARRVLRQHAKDLGAQGHDHDFGAGALQVDLNCH